MQCANTGCLGLILSVAFMQFTSVNAEEIIPIGPGSYPVASTNFQVAQEYQSLTGEEMDTYLSGHRTWYGSATYITDVMQHPAAVWTVNVNVPDISEIYAADAGETIPVAAFITYPTTDEIAAKPYKFPYHDSDYGSFAHMLQPNEAPVFAEPNKRYPLVVLAHGGSAHGVYDIGHANRIASHGYIVAVVFYGDNRFARPLSNNNQIGFLRPLLTKAVVDSIVNSEAFGQHVEANNIGVSGHSFGGFTALALAGGDIQANPNSVKDTRVKAAVAAAPWTGGSNGEEVFYAFGPNNNRLSAVTVPTITLFGTTDTVTTKESILPAMRQLSGPTYVVELVDQPHVFEGGAWQDRDNWELLFFNAYLKADPEALLLLATGTSMQGGNADRQLFEYQSGIE